jgi:hypothetical protein
VCRPRGREAVEFVREFFQERERQVLLIGGAGFDPRSAEISVLLGEGSSPAQGIFIREDRPNPDAELLRRVELNIERMMSSVRSGQAVSVDVFAPDGAVVGGRKIVAAICDQDLSAFTDVIVDLSALSLGIAYPVVRLLFEFVTRSGSGPNLHLLVTDEPRLDEEIVPTVSDRVSTVHGFQGGFGLDKNARATKLWLPQLVVGKRPILERIRAYVDPHEVCPILPFPATDPRLSDRLIEHYRNELESTWEVDARDLIYADQRNPVDLYRTILRMDDARRRVFQEVGGSMVILSPVGSKALVAGSMMAAIERDFPVVYVEPIAYSVDFEKLERIASPQPQLVHVWLAGEVYPWKSPGDEPRT